MAVAYIGLGSNLGDRRKNIRRALALLSSHPDVQIKKLSGIIETEPEGGPRQGRYLNAAVKIKTGLKPRRLLEVLLAIEKQLDRKRPVKNAPRTIDLDVLFYGGKIINTPRLKIPHPRLHKRRFVLEPLCELAPGLTHPVFRKKIKRLARQLGGELC